ncbi:YIP1 family protein [Roseinatronobacter alkalisoli]|uniref:YIP1 family protein n=1 Tax=Roseinatronobacter alkalisoli TaxID=3028235 RepID=A0ABT5TC06_9RHOB|nr:YIP1 family protein [Roseinatronobacter sp. HJB301]MDD7972531.1 YIP1 family protein [Roseinatronobacter sp. HJB301]
MSLTLNIARSYRDPAQVVRGLLGQGVREPQVLFFNLLSCGLIFVAQWPRLSRDATLDPSVTFEQRMGGALFAVMFLLPLILYALAWALQGGLRLARMPVPGLWARLALFWALLAVTPLMLVQGGLSALLGPVGAVQAFGFVVAGAFIYILGFGVRAAIRLVQDGHGTPR